MKETVEVRELINQRLYFTNNLEAEEARAARAPLPASVRRAHDELQAGRRQAIETINNTLRELGVTAPQK